MKNIVLSTVAVLAMSSFAVAGGDIAPVEEPVVVVEPVITDSGFYLGLAYGLQDSSLDYEYDYYDDDWRTDETSSSIMLQAGYKFNSYVAVEGRYWFGMDESMGLDDAMSNVDYSIDSWGIYVKPMYPVTDAFDIYALLGYASSEYTFTDGTGGEDGHSEDLDGFSWGIGAAYSFTDNVAIFIDYVHLYNDEETGLDMGYAYTLDYDISTLNFGVTYQF